MATFSYQPISPWFVKHAVTTRYFAIQGYSHFPHNFWNSYGYLIQYEGEDSHAHYQIYEHVVQFLLCTFRLIYGLGAMTGENRQLVTNEPVEFEK